MVINMHKNASLRLTCLAADAVTVAVAAVAVAGVRVVRGGHGVVHPVACRHPVVAVAAVAAVAVVAGAPGSVPACR